MNPAALLAACLAVRQGRHALAATCSLKCWHRRCSLHNVPPAADAAPPSFLRVTSARLPPGAMPVTRLHQPTP